MNIDFEKGNGLVPAIVQDADTSRVLMLGYMNEEAFEQTLTEGKVVFFSRSRQRLWTKGETSGNFLSVKEIAADCDSDTILIKAEPAGPVCHTGTDTCFNERNTNSNFLFELERIIRVRKDNPQDDSYTSELFSQGINKVAQKFGEESVELVIEAVNNNADRLAEEAADMLYHFLVLLAATGLTLDNVVRVLEERRR